MKELDKIINAIILHVEHFLHRSGGELIEFTDKQRQELHDDLEQIILHFLEEQDNVVQ